MKSLAELQALRDKAKAQMGMREDAPDNIRILVAKRGLKNVTVSQTGCIGICQFEPVAEVYVPGQEKTTYVKLNSEKAAKIVVDHIVNGNVVTEYTIGAANK